MFYFFHDSQDNFQTIKDKCSIKRRGDTNSQLWVKEVVILTQTVTFHQN